MSTDPRNVKPLPRRRLRGALAAVLLGTTVLAGSLGYGAVSAAPVDVPSATSAVQMPGSFAPLVKKVMPAVVTIMAEQAPAKSKGQGTGLPPGLPDFRGTPFEDLFKRFQDQMGPRGEDSPPHGGTSLGSGFVIDPEGYVVTNNHVVEGASNVTVTLEDGTRIPANIIGRDAKTDLALLKVKPDKPLPYLEFGDSEQAQVGDWVVAVGNPFGLGGTVTTGIVSARGRNINSGPYDDFIQTDAAINRGNSGGPMFNTQGQVVGINTAIFSPSGGSVGIGFAIPSNLAKTVVAELREHGKVDRGWLGVNIQPVTPEIAESMSLGTAKGALVANVMPDSPAAKAGVRQGDVVLTFDGKPISDARELSRVVASTRAGSEVKMVIQRGGKEQTLSVAIAKMKDESPNNPNAEEDNNTDKVAGLSLAPLNTPARQRLGIGDEVKGVVVTEVDGRSNLRTGDVIVKIDDEAVTAPAEVTAKVRNAEKAGRKAVLLLVNRGGNESFVPLKLGQP
jgi:serine protease Do